VFEDVDDFAEQLSGLTVRPVQLTSGCLRIDMSNLVFEDLIISRLESNQRVADQLYMDPSWMLVVVQLTPQRWSSYEAPPSSLTIIAPGSDYRNMVFEGFRCVEVAVRVDLAEEVGLEHWLGLTGAQAIFYLPAETTRIAERWVAQLLHRSETDKLLGFDGANAAMREAGVSFLRWLKETVHPSVAAGKDINARLRIQRYDLVEAALHIIDDTPVDQQPSVTELARILCTTRRTLLSAFVGVLGTTPSRYILARRLHFARHSLRQGTSKTVTIAALDQGFEHISRFSQHYQTLFGELPSCTLQRARRVRADEK
jgi:AraC family ethanolamine operon transcriptional activator